MTDWSTTAYRLVRKDAMAEYAATEMAPRTDDEFAAYFARCAALTSGPQPMPEQQSWRGIALESRPHVTITRAEAGLLGVEPSRCVECDALCYPRYFGRCDACLEEPFDDE